MKPDTRPFSTTTAAQVMKLFLKVIGDKRQSDFDVFVSEYEHNIVIVERSTGKGGEIHAAELFYKGAK